MYAYKIENNRYVAEYIGGEYPIDAYTSDERIDCTRYAPDAQGNPVLIPEPEPEPEPAPYVPTLAEVQAQRKEYIKQRRNSEEARSPFVFESSKFDYDSLSRERINSAVLGSTIAAISGVAPNTVVAEWRLWDNTTRDMTVGDWLEFKQAEIVRSAECFNIASSLKGAIDVAATTDEVNAIDWPVMWNFAGTLGNWPETL